MCAVQDLKPENIGVQQLDNGKYWVKLLDFGAGRTQTSLKHTQEVTTIYYRSPEAVLSLLNADTRCDQKGRLNFPHQFSISGGSVCR